MKKYFIYILLSIGFVVSSCSEDFENDVKDFKVVAGEADFSSYVALGNSLTAGFADGALYKSAQEQSYPSILYHLMGKKEGDFKQPFMPNDVGGFTDLFQQSGMTSFYGKLTLDLSSGSPVPKPSAPQGSLSESMVNGTFQNMGVPGAKSYHLLAQGYGNEAYLPLGKANPYFVRMATSPNASVLQDAMAQNPTFFTLWIGSNDVLSYAMSGATGVNQKNNIDASTYGSTDLSSPNLVAGVVNKLLEQLTANGAKGAIANIPDVTSIPYFTTIPNKPFKADNQAYTSKVDLLNNAFSSLNMVFKALGENERLINFSKTEDSAPIIIDKSLENLSTKIQQILVSNGVNPLQATLIANAYGQARQAKEGDHYVLTLSSKLGTVDESRMKNLMQMGLPQADAAQYSIIGLTLPVADKDVLTTTEIDEINATTSAINSAISQLSTKYKLALVDVNSKMKALQSGIKFNAVDYSAKFISGGAFSLDGVHLNNRGYAIIANYFADAINKKYGSNLPQVNPNNYNGTLVQ